MPIKKNIQRVDRFELNSTSNIKKTDEGYLLIEAPVARTGVYTYVNPDGSIQRDLVPAESLFNSDSMDTMKLKQITNSHPIELFVDIGTSKERKIGQVGETIKQKGDKLVAKMIVDTKEGIDAILNDGRRELSPGYLCDYDETPGVFEGEPYDVVQINRRYNHVAIVDNARGGPELAIKVDGGGSTGYMQDVIKTDSQEEKIDNIDDVDVSNNGGNMSELPTYRIGDNDHKASSEVITYIGSVKAKLDAAEDGKSKADAKNEELQTQLDETNAKLDAMEAERDSLKAKVDELEKVDLKDEVNKGVKARLELERVAKQVLKKDAKTDEMDNCSLKKAIVLEKYPKVEAKLDSKSDTYLDVWYEVVIEDLASAGDKKTDEQQARTNIVIDNADDDVEGKFSEWSGNAWKREDK